MTTVKKKRRLTGREWVCFVTYEDGTTGTVHFWASDGEVALKLASYWVPRQLNHTSPVARYDVRKLTTLSDTEIEDLFA